MVLLMWAASGAPKHYRLRDVEMPFLVPRR